MKCDISKCHAHCCYNAPIPKNYFSAYRKKIITQPIRLDYIGEDNMLGGINVMPITNEDLELNKCPFLRDDSKCNIYNVRPIICREFGTNAHKSKYLNCEYLSGEKTEITDKDVAWLFNSALQGSL